MSNTQPSMCATASSPTGANELRADDIAYLSPLLPAAAGQPLTLIFSRTLAAPGTLLGWITLWAGPDKTGRVKVAEDLEVWCFTAEHGGTARTLVPTELTDGLTPEQWANLSLTVRYAEGS